MSIIYIPYIRGTIRKTASQSEGVAPTYEGILKFTMANVADWLDIHVKILAVPKEGSDSASYELSSETIPGLRGEIFAVLDRESDYAPAYRGYMGKENDFEVIVWSLRDHNGIEHWDVSVRKLEAHCVKQSGDHQESISG